MVLLFELVVHKQKRSWVVIFFPVWNAVFLFLKIKWGLNAVGGFLELVVFESEHLKNVSIFDHWAVGLAIEMIKLVYSFDYIIKNTYTIPDLQNTNPKVHNQNNHYLMGA